MKKCATLATAGAVFAASLVGCGPGAGFLGLQDYGRDILFSIGGRLATVALLNAINPQLGNDGQTGQDAPGTGTAGATVFSVQSETFLVGAVDGDGGLAPTPIDQPELTGGAEPIAYTVAIPSNYDGTTPLTMRLRMYRSGACDGGCFILSVDARCIRDGSTTPECVGGTAADCSDGTRFVRVAPDCGQAASDRFVVIDLPLNGAGLDYPLAPGDFVAFELNTIMGDGGVYSLLGAEVATGTGQLRADIYRAGDTIPTDCQ